jgi:hypothetical protein
MMGVRLADVSETQPPIKRDGSIVLEARREEQR